MMSLLCACLVLALVHGKASAAPVTLLPSDINGGDTNTASFSNGDITLTPFIGTTQDTFNGNATRLGIDNNGTNNNAFNDPDTDPNNGNEETLQFIFSSSVGLSGISWDFSRADGDSPSGVNISGFTADPGASVTPGVSVFPNSVSYNAGVLNIQILGENFGGNVDSLTLSNPSASFGQTLVLSAVDTDQGGAQLAIRSISYVPEPTTLLLGGIAALCLVARRK